MLFQVLYFIINVTCFFFTDELKKWMGKTAGDYQRACRGTRARPSRPLELQTKDHAVREAEHDLTMRR